MEQKVSLKVIKRLLNSSSRGDVELGLEYLIARSNGRMNAVGRVLRGIGKLKKGISIDIYTNNSNISIDEYNYDIWDKENGPLDDNSIIIRL